MTSKDIELLKRCEGTGIKYKNTDPELEAYSHLLYGEYVLQNFEEIYPNVSEAYRFHALDIEQHRQYNCILTLTRKGIDVLETAEREERKLSLQTEANKIALNTDNKVEEVRKSVDVTNLIALRAEKRSENAEKKSRFAKILSIIAGFATIGSLVVATIALFYSCS